MYLKIHNKCLLLLTLFIFFYIYNSNLKTTGIEKRRTVVFFESRVNKSNDERSYLLKKQKPSRFKIREIIIAEPTELSECSNTVKVMDIHTREIFYVYKYHVRENFSQVLSLLNIKATETPKLTVATPVDTECDLDNFLKEKSKTNIQREY